MDLQTVVGLASVIVIPTAAAACFLLSSFARRRRLVAWLLAPLVYLVTAYLSVVIAVNVGLLEM